MVFLGRPRRRLRTRPIKRGHGRGAMVPPAGIDADVMHDGEQPSPDIAPPPQVGPAPGPFQAILNQVVGAVAVAHQGKGVAPEVRDLRRNQLIEFLDGASPYNGPPPPARLSSATGFQESASPWRGYRRLPDACRRCGSPRPPCAASALRPVARP